jgi:aspartyl-tRNA(Asn)/glutamyl-tRNA(Gln) amidotransferase subunit B
MPNFKTTIGLEIHVQLKTLSKMFCRCNNSAFGKQPNTTVCPVCLGMPGMLPVTNKQAVEWTIKTGLALYCEINKLSKFDRKHYFYPDLPKGYQISQYDQPLCKGGKVEVLNPDRETKIIRLNRIHLEEDAGKLIHHHKLDLKETVFVNSIGESNGSSKYSSETFVDLNRAGTPLMEIVTEPDIESPEEAAEFLRKLQNIVKNLLNVSEASMEKGHLRCDANIDIKDESGKMSPIVEIKNLNSFKFVQKALEFEAKRLAENYTSWPERRSKVTRGFNSQTGETYEQRTKEEAADYRYFPEPDLPPIDTSEFDFNALISQFGLSDEAKQSHLKRKGVADADAKVLIKDNFKYKLLHRLKAQIDDEKYWAVIAKIVVHNLFGFELTEEDFKRVDNYGLLIKLFSDNKINKNIFQQKCMAVHNGESIKNINSEQIDDKDIGKIVDEVIGRNSKEVERYHNGEKQLLGYFVGQIMKETKGMADPKLISEKLKEKLA